MIYSLPLCGDLACNIFIKNALKNPFSDSLEVLRQLLNALTVENGNLQGS
jgi:hypothetical protein